MAHQDQSKRDAIAENATMQAMQPKAVSEPSKEPLANVVGAAMLIALQDRQNLQRSLEMMRLWYNAQPLQNRQDTARNARAMMEKAKLVAEALFREIVLVSSQDMMG